MTAPRARPPAPLPRSLQDALAEYRRAEDIPAEVEERIWSTVGTDDPFEDEVATAAARLGPRRTIVGWVAMGVAAAAVLVAAWQLGGRSAQRRRPGTSPDAAVMQGETQRADGRAHEADERTSRAGTSAPSPSPSTSEQSPEGGAPEPASELPSSSSTDPMPATEPPSGRSHRGRAAPPASAEPTSPPAPSPFEAERELVARAWRELARGDEIAALATVAEHRRRFERGLLAPEREAIEVIARCRRGDADGPRRAAAFHRAQPRSPLATRVDEACRTSEHEPKERSIER